MNTLQEKTCLETASQNLILLQYLHSALAPGNGTTACVQVKILLFSQHMLGTRQHNMYYLPVPIFIYFAVLGIEPRISHTHSTN